VCRERTRQLTHAETAIAERTGKDYDSSMVNRGGKKRGEVTRRPRVVVMTD
jgi:hypothetical protein